MNKCLLIGATDGDVWGEVLASALAELGRELTIINASQIASIHSHDYELVILDAAVSSDLYKTISEIRTQDPAARVLVFSSLDDWTRAKEAMLAGAIDYKLKSLDPDQVVTILRRELLPIAPTALSPGSALPGGRP